LPEAFRAVSVWLGSLLTNHFSLVTPGPLPSDSVLSLDYEHEPEHEHEHDFFMRASSFVIRLARGSFSEGGSRGGLCEGG